jgi:branched-chain amino acid aminotransferase
MKITINKTDKSRIGEVDFENLGFGTDFSDHMFVMDYDDGEWHDPRIVPFEDLSVSPAMMTLHYAQTIFEGLKAYRTVDGDISVFRPHEHARRLNVSAERLCIPEVDTLLFMDGLKKLLDLDREWVPKKKGDSLYIRPFVFATDEYLGVGISKSYKFMIITSPVSLYYKEGLNPVSLVTSGEYSRACPGGTGYVKAGGNYAASLYPAKLAKDAGYTQVLWLDGLEHRYVEEVGTMNIFFYFDDELVTPPLSGTILGGITRDSVIDLAREWGITVNVRRITIDEVLERAEKGELKEAFGTGTAAIISPVGNIAHGEKEVIFNDYETGELSHQLYDRLSKIRYGEMEDPYDWCLRL